MLRFLDIIFSLLGLIVVSPVFFIVIPILRFSGEGEVFYRQNRVGQSGRLFSLLKFATMLKSSPSMATGDITIKNDFRILKTGRFLRASKINELPQIWNVLIGDMSLVGPRPMTEKNFSYYSEQAKQAISSVRPGLTGVGSIVFRNEENILSGMPDKVKFYQTVIAPYKGQLEIWYVKNKSILLYFKVIFFTALAVLSPGSRLYQSHFRDLDKMPPELLEAMKL